MYVCLCHGFTDGDVRCAAAPVAGTVADLYRALQVRPTCGKCVPMVRDLVRRPARTAGLTESAGAS
jgi:bacterioferritin-associated ferredoxin